MKLMKGFLLLLALSVLYLFCYLVWEHGSALIALFAAWATWLAAKEAARSADIASSSMQLSEQAALSTLEETRRFNRRSSFEERYSMLLAQHNTYHQQVCDYIDQELSVTRDSEIQRFFGYVLQPERLPESLGCLTGHLIISRYMRTLYHLLKFVSNEFYTEDDALRLMKNYTSPLRSSIRNDVLYMVAVNGLNVRTRTAQMSGYPNYQLLLHRFDFFEHAVFHSPFTPNGLDVSGDKSVFIRKLIWSHQKNYLAQMRACLLITEFTSPPLRVISPALLCMSVYDNFFRQAAHKALVSLSEEFLPDLEGYIRKMMEVYEASSEQIKDYRRCCYRTSPGAEPMKISKKMMRQFGHAVSQGAQEKINNYLFYPHNERRVISASEVAEHFDYVIRYGKFYRTVTLRGGADRVAREIMKHFNIQLEAIKIELSFYQITDTIE